MRRPVRPDRARARLASFAAALIPTLAVALAAALAAAALGACGASVDPTQDLSTGEAIIGLSDAVSGLREEDAILQAQLDSLRAVVARQDTLIARLAAVAGVPIPAP